MRAFLLSRLLMPAICLLWVCTAQADVCQSGRRQSPIDIQTSASRPLPTLEFRYQSAPLRIANDGHTVRVRFAPGQNLHIGNERYALQQFHFHTPGGDRIHGEEFPMAAHLLHKSASGQLLALVVLFRLGADHALLERLLPLIPERVDGDHLYSNTPVTAADLLPSSHRYYRYSGSLTGPPCTEGVEWLVLQQPVTLSRAQLALYRNRFADNARPVQPLHHRVVLESP